MNNHPFVLNPAMPGRTALCPAMSVAEESPMRFHMHLLPTYFPDRDPPFDVYYQQVLEQIALAEELGWDCFSFTEHHFLLYGGPMPNPAAIMCAAAARTSRIHLGSAIS